MRAAFNCPTQRLSLSLSTAQSCWDQTYTSKATMAMKLVVARPGRFLPKTMGGRRWTLPNKRLMYCFVFSASFHHPMRIKNERDRLGEHPENPEVGDRDW